MKRISASLLLSVYAIGCQSSSYSGMMNGSPGYGGHARYAQSAGAPVRASYGPKALLTMSDVHAGAGSSQQAEQPEIMPVGYNKGYGYIQNNTFVQKVAPVAPSHGGTLPGGMALPVPGPGTPGMAFAGHHGHHHHAMPAMTPLAAGPIDPNAGYAGVHPTLLGPRFNTGRTQVRFTAPAAMKIAWQIGDPNMPGSFSAPQLQAPARYNFRQAQIYRLKLTDVPNREGMEFYPTLEIYPGNSKVDAYLAHNAVPVQFTDEDFDQAQSGNYVTKVIYLPDPSFQELAIAGVETLVSTRLDPGVDPVKEAHRRGAVLAVVRLGSVDLEMPHSPELLPNGN